MSIGETVYSRIRNGKCHKCGRNGSCGVTKSSELVCRSCDPIFWEHCAEIDKNLWMNGETRSRREGEK